MDFLWYFVSQNEGFSKVVTGEPPGISIFSTGKVLRSLAKT